MTSEDAGGGEQGTTAGLFESGNFGGYYRDVRMGAHHAVSAPDLVR